MTKNDKIKEILNEYGYIRNNEIVNEIIENKLSSNFLILNEEKIIHASTDYKSYIGYNLDSIVSKMIKEENVSGERLSFKINKEFILNGPVFFTTFNDDNKKGMLIVKYNKKRFKTENIEMVYYLCKYIKL